MATIKFELVLPAEGDRRIEAEDGTVYFRSSSAVYTFRNERRLVVDVSSEMEFRGSVGSNLYFYATDKATSSGIAGMLGKKSATYVFYKTVIDEDELKLQRVNEIYATDDVEIFPEQPFYSIKRGTTLKVFGFEEDVNDEGLKFDIMGSGGVTTGYRLMHRGNLILTQTSNDAHYCHVSNTVKLLRMPLRVMGVHLRDDSDLICLLLHSQKQIIVVNTKTLVVEKLECAYDPVQPNSPSWDFAPADIVSVRDGVLTYTLGPQKDVFKNEPRQLWRGKLPEHLL